MAGVVVIIVAAAAAAWYVATHEKIEEEVWVGYRGEARYNPFLAAERLLAGLGVEAASRESFRPSRWLPAPSDTVVLRASADVATGAEFDKLTDWVSAYGGHLVLLPPREPSDAVDNLLAYFGLRLVALDRESADMGSEAGGAGAADEAQRADADYFLLLDHADYRVESDRYDPVASVADAYGNVAVRVAEGIGHVTVIASGEIFTNALIDEADHARLLLDVVAGHLEPGKVWLVFQSSFPSLAAVIWGRAPLLVSSLALLLCIWLWSAMPRFGPKLEPAAEDRRSIGEHINAAGAFTWRYAGSPALAKSAVTAVLHTAERRHPGIGRLSPEEQATTLAHLTGLDADRIFSALTPAGSERPGEFTDSIQLLQTIRKAL
jgi:hypothetical protein